MSTNVWRILVVVLITQYASTWPERISASATTDLYGQKTTVLVKVFHTDRHTHTQTHRDIHLYTDL